MSLPGSRKKRLLALMKGYYPNVKKRLLKMLVSFLLAFFVYV